MKKIKEILDNKFVRIGYTIFKVLFFGMLALYLVLVIFQRLSTNSNVFGLRTYNIVTASMMPEYEVGDVIIITEVDPKDLKVNDDVTYMGKEGQFIDKIVTHRIVDIIPSETEKIKFHTKGIANAEKDPTISEDQIYGKVVYRPKIISMVNKVIRTNTGFFFLIFVPLAIVIFLEITETVVEIMEKKKEKEVEEEII